jgi:phosphatidylinositol glycan class M
VCLIQVAFTDVDYHVFSDAAHHVRAGRSPYDRATYRYTPLLACLLVPNGIYPDFGNRHSRITDPPRSGKILFCLADLLVAVLCFAETSQICTAGVSRRRRDLWAIALLWLFNPLTAIVSARGNADVLVSAAVLATLYLINKDKVEGLYGGGRRRLSV